MIYSCGIPGRAKRQYPTPEGLDAGITAMVDALMDYGIETYESCEGGEGHSYPEPTVRFHGQPDEGFRAFAAARQRGLPVSALRRVWLVTDGELNGPTWEITFDCGIPAAAGAEYPKGDRDERVRGPQETSAPTTAGIPGRAK